MSADVIDPAALAELGVESNVRQITRNAEERPDAPVLTVADRTLTRRELELGADQWAHALAAHGVGYGDFVTLALPNSVEFVLATVAVWKLGAIPQPVSAKLPVAERRAIVELAGSTLVLGATPGDHPDRACLPIDFRPEADADSSPLPEVVSPLLKAATSGGSTGRPKLILSGSPAVTVPSAMRELFGMRPDDTQLVCGPLYHNAPFTFTTSGVVLGQHVILQPRFDALTALRQIGEHRVTYAQMVPTMLSRMLRVIDEHAEGTFDLTSIRELWHMASPCPSHLKERWIELLGGDRLIELYGGTESQAVTRITGTEWLEHRGSVGRPITGAMKIFDESGQPAPPGEVGEIYMRPDEGAPATYHYVGAQAKRIGDWESLGDLGWMDADGYVYISDRRTDMIVAGGANVYPAEVEAALESHPSVLSCVVVGIPDDDLGQRVHAVVQTAGDVDGDTLLAHLGDRLVRYKVPRSIEFWDTPLRDDAGKVRRSAVRDAVIARLTAGKVS